MAIPDDQRDAIENETEQSPEEIAAGLPLEQVTHELPRPVLDLIAEREGITHDALNMSVSKFKKLNKKQLADYIRKGAPSQAGAAGPERGDTAQQAADVPNPLEILLTGFELYQKGKKNDDYKQLDNFVASTAMQSLGASGATVPATSDPKYIHGAIVAAAAAYGVVRLVGADKIKAKAAAIKAKLFKGGEA